MGHQIDGDHAVGRAITRLSFELLGHIFELASAPETRNGFIIRDVSPFHRRSCPTNVSLVSQAWRGAAISYPRLWTRIHIWNLYPRSPNTVSLWLKRSKRMPLQIALETPQCCRVYAHSMCPKHSNPSRAQDKEILRLLVSQCYRWESVHFDIATYEDSPLLDLKKSTLQSLRSVSLVDKTRYFNPYEVCCSSKHWDHFWSAVAGASPLEAVAVYQGPSISHQSFCPLVQWQNLKKIVIQEWVDVSPLAACTRLESLVFRYGAMEPDHHLKLRRLRHLQACESPGLQYFTTPSLKSLYWKVEAPDHSLSVFLSHTPAQLEELTIDSNCWWMNGEEVNSKAYMQRGRRVVNPAVLIQLFTSMDLMNLSSLSLRGCPASRKIIDLLSETESSVVLPSLTHLTLDFPVAMNSGDIERMITCRGQGIGGIKPLEHVRIIIRSTRDEWTGLSTYLPPTPGVSKCGECTIEVVNIDAVGQTEPLAVMPLI